VNDNVDIFGLGRIDVLHSCWCRARKGLATANTYTQHAAGGK